MKSRHAITSETNDKTLDQEVIPDAPEDKRYHEMTLARKGTLGKARENAKELRVRLEISNERYKSVEQPQSTNPNIETPSFFFNNLLQKLILILVFLKFACQGGQVFL